jgi:cell division protein FtsQ
MNELMVRQGGASRGQRSATRSSRKVDSSVWIKVVVWFKRCLLTVVLGSVVFGFIVVWQWLLAIPVGSVDVESRFVYVEKNELEEVITSNINTGFLMLDLQALKTVIEDLEWVAEARVGRAWPDKVKVTVIEQRPIARWGKTDLPLLNGPVDKPQLVMQQYQEMAELLAPQGLGIEEVLCDEAENWTLKLTGGVVLNIGRYQVLDKMARFLLVYQKQLKARWIELKHVDLRYDNGVAVEWLV